MARACIKKTSLGFVRCVDEDCHPIPYPWHLGESDLGFEALEIDFDIRTLTSMEANLAFNSFYQQLDVGGCLTFTVADFDYFSRLWVQANWSEEAILRSDSPARLSFSQIWGTQERGNPELSEYSVSDQILFKSGYNQARLLFLLERAGFLRSDVHSENGLLSVKTFKVVNKGERQVASHIRNIRSDHVARYNFAAQQLKALRGARVLDLACGVGYGSQILETVSGAVVTGVDIDKGAIEYARAHYPLALGGYLCCDASTLEVDEASFDAVVSFETIEHVSDPDMLVDLFAKAIKPGGLFICSTPNQAVMPFSAVAFPHHTRHFFVAQMKEMLAVHGFQVTSTHMQSDSANGVISPGDSGMFSIFVSQRV